jgi:GntR family transcriptional regulator
MILRLDTKSGVPIYQQIVDQIKHMIASGTLGDGDRLPTVRELGNQLVINPNTVGRAYMELEREQVIETRRGLGSYVCGNGTKLTSDARIQLVSDLIDRVLVEAHHVDVSPAQVRELLEKRLAVLFPSEENTQ